MKCKSCGGLGFFLNPFDERFKCDCMKKKKSTRNKTKEMTMTDSQMYEILNSFANNSAVAKGGNLKVTVGPMGKTFDGVYNGSMHVEEVELLSDIIRGAEMFLFWARRNHVVNVRKRV